MLDMVSIGGLMQDRWAVVDDSIRRAKLQSRISSVLLMGLYAIEAALIAGAAIVVVAVGVRLGMQ